MASDDYWQEPESIWEKRRKAPWHFFAKADNARMSAFVLSHIDKAQADQFSKEAEYGGAHAFALGEGFRREAAISLELILKAILCVKTKSPPPPSHDVYELWAQAGLPKTTDDDAYRLAELSQLLYWAGRYAAPRRDTDLGKSQERLDRHKRTKNLGSLKVQTFIPLNWEEFDALYQTAASHFWELEPNKPENFVS
ncbi:hypothetical protein J4717_08145 [Phaeobacter sp. HS012]|uniref:hypothetical protein n=1 Tax=unclassified Phaeobacter TaxID=2621772 RepID=UPI001B36CF59|nr:MULTISPECIES: hypothetical protein [unclassified Phaeobacter]MBQ4807434.1 hypothetical protein [Phaeobacter sp. HS012]MBQ4881902.1 hypothetical protein [Phaeobacter sp. HS011]